MFCCSHIPKQYQNYNILQYFPEPCLRHSNNRIEFICQTCILSPLLCKYCKDDHQGHNYTSIDNYFDENLKNVLKRGGSKNWRDVDQAVQRICMRLVVYEQKVERKLKESVANVIMELQKLKSRFIINESNGLFENEINNKTMSQIIRVVNNDKIAFDTKIMERTFNQILNSSFSQINHNFVTMKQTLTNHKWENLSPIQIQQIRTDFLSIYVKKEENNKFHFSPDERCLSVDLNQNRLACIYSRQVPKKPVVIVDKFLTQKNNRIGFKITKMQTQIHFFNMSIVYIGVVNHMLAHKHSFLDLAKLSKGAYLVSSDGKTYHSSLSQYHESSAFGFGKGDIITVELNIQNNSIIFQKKTGIIPFLRKVQIRLNLNDKQILQLRPCVMFSNDIGAEVIILNEDQLDLEIQGKKVFPVIGAQY